jgi:hypothetical protein
VSRGRVSVIRDPAIAVAAAKCWMARWNGGRSAKMVGLTVNSFHPAECGFCDFPAERLIEAVDEFNTWAGLKPPRFIGESSAVRDTVETFLSLPVHEQKRLVGKAQGYEVEGDNEEDV